MIHHVSLEVRVADVEACVRFWGVLGFDPVDAPGSLGERSTWVQRDGQQIHLLHADEPVIPAEAHVAIVCGAYADVTDALRAFGAEVLPRTEYWGAPRCFVTCPAGHRVEVMQAPPAS